MCRAALPVAERGFELGQDFLQCDIADNRQHGVVRQVHLAMKSSQISRSDFLYGFSRRKQDACRMAAVDGQVETFLGQKRCLSTQQWLRGYRPAFITLNFISRKL